MKLEKQVCTLEQAKKLKELGVNQDSLFYFYSGGFLSWEEGLIKTADWRNDRNVNETTYSAFTTSELLLMNYELITINKMQLQNSATEIAAHLIGRIESGEITSEEVNENLSND